MTRFFALVGTVLVGGGVLLTGCARNPVTGKSDVTMVSEKGEIEQGRKAHEQVIKFYGVYEDQALQDYINEVGQKLAHNSQRPELEWHFTIVDSQEINAFALPGGYIYITRGILAYLNNEAELAAVLGHVGEQIRVLTADRARRNLRRRETAAATANRICDFQRLGTAAGGQPQLRRIDVAVVAGDDRCGAKERLSVGVYDTLQVVRLYLEAAIGKDCESGGELGRRELQAPERQGQVIRQGGALKTKTLQVVHRVRNAHA